MAVLLVGMSIMAIMMTVAMPTWRQLNQREKEAELVFRGEQYARAIGLYQRKMGPGTLPPTIDVLVEQRFIRKKFKDPVTGEDFVPLAQTVNAPGPAAAQGGQQGRGGAQPGGLGAGGGQRGGTATASTPGNPTGTPGQAPGQGFGGISGVTSKSKDASIRIYNGRTHYNEWEFRYTPPPQAAGANSGAGVPGVGGGGRAGQPNGPQGANPLGLPGGPGRQGTQPPNRGGPGFPGGPQNPNGPGRGPGGGFNPFQPPTRSGR
jgi:type II secretory pathway pseudopilin PulG